MRGLTDPAGALLGSADYDVFGGVRVASGAASIFGFTGEQLDAETGYTFLRARYLDPVLGRFISADSVQPNAPGTQGWNPYSYVANNPTTWIDASGHTSWLGPDPRGRYNTLGACGTCGNWHVRDVPPLIIEWMPGSEVIGDFVWAHGHVVVKASVIEALSERFHGAEAGPIEMWQDPRLHRPRRVTRRTKPRVWLPYEGPPLVELVVPATVKADESRSTLKDHWVCHECGRPSGEVPGIERKWGDHLISGGITFQASPRQPGVGYLISSKEMGGLDFVRLYQAGGLILLTAPVKRFIEEREYSNIDFWEVGEVFD